MRLDFSPSKPLDAKADLLILPVFQGKERTDPRIVELDRSLGGWLRATLKAERFRGEAGRSTSLTPPAPMRSHRLVLVGLGKPEEFDGEKARRAYGRAIRLAASFRARSVAACLPLEGDLKENVGALAEGVLLGSYRFLRYKSNEEKKNRLPESVSILREGKPEAKGLVEALARAEIVCEAAGYARDLVNEPPSAMTPATIAREALALGRELSLRVKVLGPAEVKRMGMGALVAVARGSPIGPRLIHLEYRPRLAQRHIALVGKGITFDAGGLSLKTAQQMESMKCDMAGAAAVLGAIRAVARLKLPVRLHGVIPAAENLPDGGAVKPGDVVRTLGGKTVEILNTDAEGRLILADALAYAERLKVEEIIDLATLTGACTVALGNSLAGVFCRDARMMQRLSDAARLTGEPLWSLPLVDDYREDLKSQVADLKNVGGRFGGAINGALFLGEFVKLEQWAHIDIAGPAWAEKEGAYTPKGGTGFGVRLLARYLSGSRR